MWHLVLESLSLGLKGPKGLRTQPAARSRGQKNWKIAFDNCNRTSRIQSGSAPAAVLRRTMVSWERFGKELKTLKRHLSRTESTGRVFLYVLITRRSSVQ